MVNKQFVLCNGESHCTKLLECSQPTPPQGREDMFGSSFCEGWKSTTQVGCRGSPCIYIYIYIYVCIYIYINHIYIYMYIYMVRPHHDLSLLDFFLAWYDYIYI